MILGALGDIRGNISALEKVVSALDEEGIQTLVNTGDCVCGHPSPNEVIALLRSRNIPSVQGLWDRRVVRFQRKQQTLRRSLSEKEFELLEQTYAAVSSDNLEYLRSLPKSLNLTVDGVAIGVCHGTFTSQTEHLRATDSLDRFRRQRELLSSSVVISGHGDRRFEKTVDGTLFLNPGSVGMTDDRVAQYAVVSTEQMPWSVDFRSIG